MASALRHLRRRPPRGNHPQGADPLQTQIHAGHNGWTIDGDWFEWDYSIRSASGETVAIISKELLHWSDVYAIDAPNPSDALPALLVALAIDAEKCSRGD